MLDFKPKDALSDIAAITMDTVAPFTTNAFVSAPKHGYKKFEGPDRHTTYLLFTHEDRVLFYGVDIPKKKFIVPMLADRRGEKPSKESLDVIQTLFDPCIFARRGTVTDDEFSDLIHAETDDDIDGLEVVIPYEDESDNDFFLRNAMWLLDPVVH